MAKGEGGCAASIHSSVASPKKWATKSLDNSAVSPRSLLRSNGTCFFVGPWGKHSVTDPGGEWGHPVVCIGVLSCCVLLTPSSWIPAAWAADEVCLKSGTIAHSCGVGIVGLEMARYGWGSCGSLGRCLTCLLVLWWLTLMLLHSVSMFSAVQLWAPLHGVTSWPLGNLLPPTLHWGWPSMGQRVGLQVPPPPRQGLGCCHHTPEASPYQALA